jgi:hypothetical protein
MSRVRDLPDEGRVPDGSEFADWIQAEREVLAELSAAVGLDAAPEAVDEQPVKKRRTGVKRAPRKTTGKTSEA